MFEMGDGRVRFETVETKKVIEVNGEEEESWLDMRVTSDKSCGWLIAAGAPESTQSDTKWKNMCLRSIRGIKCVFLALISI